MCVLFGRRFLLLPKLESLRDFNLVCISCFKNSVLDSIMQQCKFPETVVFSLFWSSIETDYCEFTDV